jgi:hypothetical protein
MGDHGYGNALRASRARAPGAVRGEERARARSRAGRGTKSRRALLREILGRDLHERGEVPIEPESAIGNAGHGRLLGQRLWNGVKTRKRCA